MDVGECSDRLGSIEVEVDREMGEYVYTSTLSFYWATVPQAIRG